MAVVGVGGVGSSVVEALARSGVGAITMIDMDDGCGHVLENAGAPEVEDLRTPSTIIAPALEKLAGQDGRQRKPRFKVVIAP